VPGDGDTASLRDDLTQAGARRRYDTILGEGERMGGEVVVVAAARYHYQWGIYE